MERAALDVRAHRQGNAEHPRDLADTPPPPRRDDIPGYLAETTKHLLPGATT